MTEVTAFRKELKAICDAEWEKIKAGRFFQMMKRPELQRDLYIKSIVQVYHYTKNNAINQAVACWN
ncbi:transcriptional activator, TenA family protein, partial [Pseudomonas frederiksbergensis]|nr:transcriptional activator, TenA family protein [Pseudomonas frederiksbergensis]